MNNDRKIKPSRRTSPDMYEALHSSFFPRGTDRSSSGGELNQFDMLPTAHLFFNDLIERIGEAKETVDLQFYTLEADSEVYRVVKAGLEAAARGVKVRFLADHIVSDPRRLWATLQMNREIERTANASVRRLRVAEGLANIVTRDHKKIAAIDTGLTCGCAYIGGINLAARALRWNDFMVRMKGPVAGLVGQDFNDSWNGENHTAKWQAAQDMETYLLTDSGREQHIADFSLKAVRQAKEAVWLETPYLDMRGIATELIGAKNDNPGLDVRVILPRYNNYPLDRVKTHANKARLEAAGIEVYLYGKTFRRLNHTKLLIVDTMGLFGSSNFNAGGLAGGNAEIAVATENAKVVKQLKRWYVEDMQEAA